MNRFLATLVGAGILIGAGQTGWAASSAYPIVVSEEPVTPSADTVQYFVVAWLNCYECNSGELKRVLDSGAEAIPVLQAVMADDPQYYPDRSEEYDAQWLAVKAHAEAPATSFEISTSQESFRSLQKAAVRNTYKARARKALELLGAPVP